MPTVVVYALEFSDGTIYVGLSDDLLQRLKDHRRRKSPSTKRFVGDFQVVYQKTFPNHRAARCHEKYLKSGAGRKFLRQTIMAEKVSSQANGFSCTSG
jgi:putative endonuclease